MERIVREVLAEIGKPERHAAAASGSKSELVLSGKVVSLAAVEDRLEGVTRIVVPRGAVFTPAARDEIRKHKVAIASAVPATSVTGRQIALGVTETTYDATPLAAALETEGARIERLAPGSLIGVTDNLCQQVATGGRLGLLMTNQTAAALCLANRRRGVRAALGHSVRAAVDAVNAIAANLLVIDPTDKSVVELRQISRQLIRADRSAFQGALAERLN